MQKIGLRAAAVTALVAFGSFVATGAQAVVSWNG